MATQYIKYAKKCEKKCFFQIYFIRKNLSKLKGVIYLWYEFPHLSYHRYTNWCKPYWGKL